MSEITTVNSYAPVEESTKEQEPEYISLDGMVFGMPPDTYVSNNLMKNSMPTAIIIPCEPRFTEGLSLFSLDQDKGFKTYFDILKSVGFLRYNRYIKVAFLADNFPTDTFSNEYGETFLDNFSQAASSALGDVSQVMGWKDYKDVKDGISKVLPNLPGGQWALNKANEIDPETTINNLLTKVTGPNRSKTIIDTAKAMATGARVDFPMVWKNSSFQPSYSMTIRLYNPNPSSVLATRKYIVGPIAALLALALPNVAEDSATYKWPLLCKVLCVGIYNLQAAYISSISVVKGGDQQNIGFNQALGIVDVRVDFGSLYSSILAGEKSRELGNERPTLGSYLEAIGGAPVTEMGKRKTLARRDIAALNDNIQQSNYVDQKMANAPTNVTTDTETGRTGIDNWIIDRVPTAVKVVGEVLQEKVKEVTTAFQDLYGRR